MKRAFIHSIVVLSLTLMLNGKASSQDRIDCKSNPISAADLAKLFGIKKSGWKCKLPEKRHLRLVAEITVNGEKRKEFITLMSPAQDFTVAVFTEHKPGASVFRRLICEITSGNGAESRRSFYDFAGAVMHQEATTPQDDGSVMVSLAFRADSNGPNVAVEDVGNVRIYLESSAQAFSTNQ